MTTEIKALNIALINRNCEIQSLRHHIEKISGDNLTFDEMEKLNLRKKFVLLVRALDCADIDVKWEEEIQNWRILK